MKESAGDVHDDGLLVAEGVSDAAAALLPAPLRIRLDDVLVTPPVGPAWRGKRIMDVVLALLLLVVSLPLFVVLAIVIKVTSPGPVFFRQRRVGRGGEQFPILKFRTMRADSERRLRSDAALRRIYLRNDHKIPSHLDPRVTHVGIVLRRLSLDELPQLINVLAGHMSLVGPRPVVHSEFLRDYRGYESSYLALRPGLTGLWQVSGRSRIHFPERADLDDEYVQSCSPWTDVKIILRTPRAVVTGLGAD